MRSGPSSVRPFLPETSREGAVGTDELLGFSGCCAGARLAEQKGAGEELDLVGTLQALGDVESDDEAVRSDDE